jgi:hypothetical protein
MSVEPTSCALPKEGAFWTQQSGGSIHWYHRRLGSFAVDISVMQLRAPKARGLAEVGLVVQQEPGQTLCALVSTSSLAVPRASCLVLHASCLMPHASSGYTIYVAAGDTRRLSLG